MRVTHEALSKELQCEAIASEWVMIYFSLLRKKCHVLLKNKDLSTFIE
jgi:hypothetical protein